MEKESVKKFDLEAAFKALDEIEIPVAERGIKANRVDLKERFSQKSAHEALVEDYYDVSNVEDLKDAHDERDGEIAKAKLAKIEKIVDLDAESPEDLLPSYVGKVIIQCPQCMTLFYKNPEDIEHSEENPDVVNINEVCQHCGNSSGYTLIGKVGAVEEDEADQYTEEPVAKEESELDLDFEEPTEEVDAEGTGEGADELSDEELAELNRELEEIPTEEEEEKKEESLNHSEVEREAEKGSELFTDHKSENLTLNEAKGENKKYIEQLYSYIPDNIKQFLNVEVDSSLNPDGDNGTSVVGDISFKFDQSREAIAAAKKLVNVLLDHLDQDKYHYQIWDVSSNGRSNGSKSIEDIMDNYFNTDAFKEDDYDGWLTFSVYDKSMLNKTNESLNNSKAQKDAEEGSELKTENESENLTLNEAKYDAELTVHDTWQVKDIEAADEEEAEEIAQEKIDNGEEDDYSEYDDGIKVTKISEGLNEEIDKDLDKKLKAHNDYIEYLKKMIEQEEEALKNTDNEEVKAAIQRRLDAFNADLEAALPDAVKEMAVAEEEAPTEVQAEEEPKEEATVEETAEIEEEAPVEKALTEEAEEEQPAEEPKEEGDEVDYVKYKHSYCHILEPKLKAINYLVHVKKVEPKILKGYILKLLKDPEIKWTEKEEEFKKNIQEKDDVYDILNYVKNSVEKAKTIKVKIDKNGELIESLNEGFEGCLYEVLTESVNNSEAQKDAEKGSDLKTENESDKLTLNEDGDDATIANIINS